METKIEYKIGDRVRILPRNDNRYHHWQGDVGTIEKLGPWFDDGVPRTVTMRFDVAHSGMSGMIIQPDEIEHI